MPDPTDAGNISILPGFELKPPRISDFGTITKYFEQAHIASLIGGIKAAGGDEARAIEAANRFLASTKAYSYGRPGFNAAINASENLPAMLWLCLRIKQPRMTMEQAAELLTMDNFDAIHLAVLEMWGYKRPLSQTGEEEKPATALSGSTSSPAPSSPNTESVPPITPA